MTLEPYSMDEWSSYLRDTIAGSSAIRTRLPYVERLLAGEQQAGNSAQTGGTGQQDGVPTSPASAAVATPLPGAPESKEIEEFLEWLKLMHQGGPKSCSTNDLLGTGWWMRPLVVPLCRALANWAATGHFPYAPDEDMRPPMLNECKSYFKARDELEAVIPQLAELLKSSHETLPSPHQHSDLMEKMLPPADQLAQQEFPSIPDAGGGVDGVGTLADPILSGCWELAAQVALAGSSSASAVNSSGHLAPLQHNDSGSGQYGFFGGGFGGAFSAAGLRDMVLRPSESGSASPRDVDTIAAEHSSGSLPVESQSPPALAKSVRSRIGRLDIVSDATSLCASKLSSSPSSCRAVMAVAREPPMSSSEDEDAEEPSASALVTEATLALPELDAECLKSVYSLRARGSAAPELSPVDFTLAAPAARAVGESAESSGSAAAAGIKSARGAFSEQATGDASGPTAPPAAFDSAALAPNPFLSHLQVDSVTTASSLTLLPPSVEDTDSPTALRPAQPLAPMEELLLQLLQDPHKVLVLLGFRITDGTSLQLECLPSLSECLGAFTAAHAPASKSKQTVGAEALAKHANWNTSSSFWEPATGPQCLKNALALRVLAKVVSGGSWRNLHSLPEGGVILELRIPQGYGAYWEVSVDRTVNFRGFLEPISPDGSPEPVWGS